MDAHGQDLTPEPEDLAPVFGSFSAAELTPQPESEPQQQEADTKPVSDDGQSSERDSSSADASVEVSARRRKRSCIHCGKLRLIRNMGPHEVRCGLHLRTTAGKYALQITMALVGLKTMPTRMPACKGLFKRVREMVAARSQPAFPLDKYDISAMDMLQLIKEASEVPDTSGTAATKFVRERLRSDISEHEVCQAILWSFVGVYGRSKYFTDLRELYETQKLFAEGMTVTGSGVKNEGQLHIKP